MQAAEHVPELAGLGRQVLAVVRVEADFQRAALGDTYAETFQRLDLVLRTALATRDDGSTVSMRREMKKIKIKIKIKIKNTTTTIPTKGRTKKI